MSILPARVIGEARLLAVGNTQVPIPEEVLAARPGLAQAGDILVGIRAEHATLVSADADDALDGVVRSVEGLGPDTFIRVDYDAGPHEPPPASPGAEGDALDGPAEDGPGGAADAISPVITVRRSGTATVRPGQRCRVGVDPTLCHFFDVDGGAIR